MKILLTDAGKRFNRDWIFRHLTYHFETRCTYAITGPNGSGKSTLLQVIAGALQVSEGSLTFDHKLNNTTGKELNNDSLFRYISIAAPYLEVVEEMTLHEFLSFHNQFKPLLPGIDIEQVISTCGLSHASNKQIRYFSSGMKQRVKLAQALFSDTPILLLDEPCTNLDEEGIQLYHNLIETYCGDRMTVVSSNDPIEYKFCQKNIRITDYKV